MGAPFLRQRNLRWPGMVLCKTICAGGAPGRPRPDLASFAGRAAGHIDRARHNPSGPERPPRKKTGYSPRSTLTLGSKPNFLILYCKSCRVMPNCRAVREMLYPLSVRTWRIN